MPTSTQWKHLRNLDRIAAKAQPGTFRERYMRQQIDNLRRDMGLSPLSPPRPKGDTGADEHLPDSLSANADLFGDL